MHPSPTPIDRKLYGPLVDDVYVLRAAGHDVSRFKGDYRVGKEVVTAVGLRVLASAQRARQQALAATRKPDSPRSKRARHAISETAGGTPSGGGAGTAEINGGPGGASAIHSAGTGPTCTKCGGPRSKWSTGLCRACYVPAGRANDPAPPSADVRDKFARTNTNAAPDGCADVATSDVPPGTTPQTEASAATSVTPAHEAGELGAGTVQTALQGLMPNAGDGGETAATRGRPSPLKSQAVTKPPNAGGSHDAGLKTRRQEVARVAPPAVLCKCGNPKGHGGRCWVLKRRHRQGGTCRCGAPLSISARGDLCRKCHLATVRKTSGQSAQIVALWCEVDALKSRAERAENAISAIRAQLDMGGR